MAETGNFPIVDLEYNLGNSGGGFDKIRFKLPQKKNRLDLNDEKIDTSIDLNKRNDGRPEKTLSIDTSIDLNKRNDGRPEKTLSIPCYGGGMSYGSTALPVIVGRARAAKRINTLTCTGEGGYPVELAPYADYVITQVATGLFGVTEESSNTPRVPSLVWEVTCWEIK